MRESQRAAKRGMADNQSLRWLRCLVVQSFGVWRGKIRERRRLLLGFRKLGMRGALRCAKAAFHVWKTAFDNWQDLRTGIGALFAKVNRRLCTDMLWEWLHVVRELHQHLHVGGTVLLRANATRRARFLIAWRVASKSRSVLREYAVHISERSRLWVLARVATAWTSEARRSAYLRSRHLTVSVKTARSGLFAAFLAWCAVHILMWLCSCLWL